MDRLAELTRQHIKNVIDSGMCERCKKYGYEPAGKPTVHWNIGTFFVVCEKCNIEMTAMLDDYRKQQEAERLEERDY